LPTPARFSRICILLALAAGTLAGCSSSSIVAARSPKCGESKPQQISDVPTTAPTTYIVPDYGVSPTTVAHSCGRKSVGATDASTSPSVSAVDDQATTTTIDRRTGPDASLMVLAPHSVPRGETVDRDTPAGAEPPPLPALIPVTQGVMEYRADNSSPSVPGAIDSHAYTYSSDSNAHQVYKAYILQELIGSKVECHSQTKLGSEATCIVWPGKSSEYWIVWRNGATVLYLRVYWDFGGSGAEKATIKLAKTMELHATTVTETVHR
jgi:hypothetical protein